MTNYMDQYNPHALMAPQSVQSVPANQQIQAASTNEDDFGRRLWQERRRKEMLAEIEIQKKSYESQIHYNEVKALLDYKDKMAEKTALMKEKRKHQIAKMEVDGNGNVILKIQNPVFELPSYTITNMREPQLFVLESIHDKKRQYCILCCYINDEITRVYLDRNRLTKGGYLLGKLSAAGITWTIKTSTKAVHLFTQLITELINNDDRKIFLPEDIGWQVLDSGEFKYVEEGEPTWKKIIEWAK